MKKLLLISMVTMGMTFCSCDDYLDINQDPNAPSAELVSSDMLMPAIEMNLASNYSDYLRIVGGYFSQHFAQTFGTSNYLDYSQFTMSATRCSGTYSDLYQRVLGNLATILDKSKASEEWGTYLAATTLRAFTYQTLVDCFGEVPYAEALDINNVKPKYDDGKVIYEGVLAELDEALEKVSAGDLVCKNFLFPSATADSWIKFANALKLKMYMRMANVMDVKDKLSSLVAEGNFPTSDVAFEGCWKGVSGEMNPYYSEEFATSWGSTQVNIIANLAIVGTMQTDTYTDPRLAAFFESNADGNYVGGLSGTNFPNTNAFKLSYWCRPVASYDMPAYLITVSEVEFFLAEYYARYGSEADASLHYAKAIEASFATAGVGGADDYLKQYPYDNSNYAKCLGVAKWVALAGTNDFEAWCELRRLDYPAFGEKQGSDFYNLQTDESFNVASYVPGTLYTPINYFGQLGANKVLERFPYAESSSARNSNTPDFPGYAVPVFWGK